MTDYFMRAICFGAIPATQLIEFHIQYIGTIMPNYEFMCVNVCEGLTIILDLPMDHEIPCCQVCGVKLRRVYSSVPAIFKGTGWAGKGG
jgi:predicted nucleic acid-binding Zn ribbon protein